MKVAIYNGFSFIHYEMIGHVIEYCIQFNFDFNIYACYDTFNKMEVEIYSKMEETNHLPYKEYDIHYKKHLYGIQWKEYYEKIFNNKLNWFYPELLNPDNYDIIFLLTDSDVIGSSIVLNNYDKIICIFHTDINVKKVYFGNILVRYQYLNNNINWVLPCYIGITKEDKQKLLLKNNKIIVTCIGSVYGDINVELILKKHFYKSYDEIEFNIISRKIKYSYNSSNILLHENCSTDIMYNILKKTNYIFCIKSIDEYNASKLSAVIPLGLSFGCQLIIPSEWYRYYNLNSVISYDEKSKFILDKNINLNSIYNELFDLIQHKNNIYNDLFSERKLNISFPELYILKISDIYNIILPNIYFGIDNKLKEYFKNSFFLDHELENINEPVFIYIDNIDKYFNIINNRKYKDIIICNIDNNIDIINNTIKKIKFIDIFHNKILIIFQK